MNRDFRNTGNIIKRLRVRAGVSQEYVAKEIGYKNGQFISNIERGICSLPYDKVKVFVNNTLSRDNPFEDINLGYIKNAMKMDFMRTMDIAINE